MGVFLDPCTKQFYCSSTVTYVETWWGAPEGRAWHWCRRINESEDKSWSPAENKCELGVIGGIRLLACFYHSTAANSDKLKWMELSDAGMMYTKQFK